MKIELHEISVREIAENYVDSQEEGVIGYNGKLNIRPKYQREFVYDETKRNAVIDTIRKGFPLNVMYWVKNDDGTFEVLDGQQRTISFCQYVTNCFSIFINGYPKSFMNLTPTEKNQLLDYKVMVYFCEGNDDEKLAWFETINIAGEKLTDQELRNATYTGPWLTHAKSIFSKTNCPAYLLSKDYVSAVPIRQELLEIALDWKSQKNIKDYMAAHQHDPNADELWTYFMNVINWVSLKFKVKRKEMKSVPWGPLYDRYHDQPLNAATLEAEIKTLMEDDDVTKKSGIYQYVLSKNEKYLSLRAFTPSQKRSAYERQNGVCPVCGKHFAIEEMEADHITPWHEGGKTIPENCQMLCKDCNRHKSGK